MVRVPSMLLPQRFNVWLWTECILKLCKKRYYNFNTQRWSYWAIEFQAHYDGTNCHKIFSLNFSKTYDGHVSSLTERQKSFRKEDGTANNLITIQAIAEKNIKNLKPLNLALDIKKAFDSVNIGLQKMGAPDLLLWYIGNSAQTSSSSEDETSLSDSASDSDDDAPIRLTGVWGPAGRQPELNAFLGRQGPSSACSPMDVKSPLEYFLLIFDREVFGKVVIETNHYADQDLKG